MATIQSELIARLRDGISGPAGKAGRSLDALAKKGNARGGYFGKTIASMRESGLSLGGLGLAGGIAAGGAAVTKAFTDFAEADRRLTRLGITAEATGDEIAKARAQMRQTAQTYGVGVDDVVAGAESLVSSGMSLSDTMQRLPAVVAAAQASGAKVDDIANSAVALASNLKIAPADMMKAFDMMANAGKLGSFELRDMARYFPSIGAQAASLGFKGADGVNKLTAALQVARMQTGTAEEAATNLGDFYGKLFSQQTVKNFRKMGFRDYEKDLRASVAAGKDLNEVMAGFITKATGGDLSKIGLLFQDKQAQGFARALVMGLDKYRAMRGEIADSAGTVAADAKRVTADAQSSIDRLGNSIRGLWQASGSVVAGAGMPGWLNDLSANIDSVNVSLDNLGKRIKDGGILGGLAQAYQDDNERARAEPGAMTLFATGGFEGETKRIQAERKSLAENQDLQRIQARRDQSKRRYEGGVAAGTSSPKSREIFLREQATADAAEADVRRRHIREQAAISRQLADRAEKQFKYDRPDFKESRTKDDSFTYRPQFGPAMPPRSALPPRAAVAPATGAPMPPARPPEIAPKVDASSIDAATSKAQELQGQLAATNGQTVTATVSLQNADASLATLRAISAEITKINGSVLKQFGAGGSGNGSFSDTGVGG